MGWLGKDRRRLFRGQRGISLIETVIALALLGLIGVAFLSGLITSSRTVAMSQEIVTVESLAKSQMEHIKSQDYIMVVDYDPVTNYYEKLDIPADLASQYDIEIMSPETIIAPDLGPFELQSITVVIKRNGKGVLTMSIYRQGVTS
ncbi:prepilin-type N-terminal cleavage/methylation domain-containing protein [Chloroflexota bacterium]